MPVPVTAAFATRKALKAAVDECLKLSPVGDCSAGPNGPIGLWDVSAVTDMSKMFFHARAFNQDLSKWDVSAVKDMSLMFAYASSFNQDLWKWHVSAVVNMRKMFVKTSSLRKKPRWWKPDRDRRRWKPDPYHHMDL